MIKFIYSEKEKEIKFMYQVCLLLCQLFCDNQRRNLSITELVAELKDEKKDGGIRYKINFNQSDLKETLSVLEENEIIIYQGQTVKRGEKYFFWKLLVRLVCSGLG